MTTFSIVHYAHREILAVPHLLVNGCSQSMYEKYFFVVVHRSKSFVYFSWFYDNILI